MPINNNAILAVDGGEPGSLREWCYHDQSLTDKLKAITGGVQLKVLSQQWARASWWDKYLLKLADNTVFERDILMTHQHITYWYARSIIPESCYRLDPEFFNRLRQESIRNLIFSEERVTRTNMWCYSINAECLEFYWVNQYLNDKAQEHSEPLWVRLVEYSFQQQGTFYLIEILFPELGHLHD